MMQVHGLTKFFVLTLFVVFIQSCSSKRVPELAETHFHNEFLDPSKPLWIESPHDFCKNLAKLCFSIEGKTEQDAIDNLMENINDLIKSLDKGLNTKSLELFQIYLKENVVKWHEVKNVNAQYYLYTIELSQIENFIHDNEYIQHDKSFQTMIKSELL